MQPAITGDLSGVLHSGPARRLPKGYAPAERQISHVGIQQGYYTVPMCISSGENALPLKVGRRPLLHGGFVCESRYFRLDYKTQNVPSLQVRAVMENV